MLIKKIARIWIKYLKSQFVLMAFIGGLTYLCALLIGLPYAPLMALVAAICELIPNVGPFLAAVPAVSAAFLRGSSVLAVSNWKFALIVAAVYILIQIAENIILKPKIAGDSLDIPPIVAFFAVVLFTAAFNVIGAAIALPVIATVREIVLSLFYPEIANPPCPAAQSKARVVGGIVPGKLFESVPNFSEGRNAETIGALRRAVEKTSSVRLIDVHSDADHNRSVFTLIGEAEPLRECILNLVATAIEKIDLNTQRGVHPRIGAVDVVPFIPLRNASMADAVRLAESTAEAISARFNIPTYLYANAARRSDRTKLSQLRKGNYEKLRGAIRDDPYFEPDFGPRELTAAGATAVGARDFLIAYNVYLNSADVAVAKAVAKKIRESSGGLPALQAVGLPVGGQAQVSTNILDYRVTPLKTVFDTVKVEAECFGTSVARAELVGCLPAAALAGTTPADIGLAEPIGDKILDRYYGGKK